MQWRKVGSLPAKADCDEQQAFVDRKLAPKLREAVRGQRTVLFLDASHFVYGAYLGYLWCVVRLFVPTGNGRQRYSVLGAINAVTHRIHAITTWGMVDSEFVCQLLREIRSSYAGKITIVLDNASYQKSAQVIALARKLRIHLLYLPPYSPNLNLIERLWKFLKGKCLNSRYHADAKAMQSHIDDCLCDIQAERYSEELQTLMIHNFQSFAKVPTVAA